MKGPHMEHSHDPLALKVEETPRPTYRFATRTTLGTRPAASPALSARRDPADVKSGHNVVSTC